MSYCYNANKYLNSLPLEVKIKSNFNSLKSAAKIHLRSQLQLIKAGNII